MNQLSLGTLFPGISGGQGGVFMQHTGGAPLAGEADVQMISGVEPVGSGPAPAIPSSSFGGQLSLPVTLGSITLPLWQWLVFAALLGGAGGYYLGRR